MKRMNVSHERWSRRVAGVGFMMALSVMLSALTPNGAMASVVQVSAATRTH